MQPVTIPRFGSAGQAPPQSAPGGAWATADQQANPNGDPLDFDMLAEYLLDDGNALPGSTAAGLPQFDFSVEPGMNSGVVSPEQSEDGFPPFGDGIPALPPAPVPTAVSATNLGAPIAAPSPLLHHVPAPQMAVAMAPAPIAVAATAPIAAPPTATSLAMMAASVQAPTLLVQQPQARPLAAAPAPATFVTMPSMVTHVATAPAPAQTLVVHQHLATAAAAVGNKRRRTDVPGAAPPLQAAAQVVTHGGRRQKSQAQIDRRRERNRILARRTRLRKKFFFESLQKEVTDLQKENLRLKDIVKKKLSPDVSKKILSECTALDNLPSAVTEACGEALGQVDQKDFNLVRNVQRSQQCFVITDPSLQDNPIVYASDDFLEMTGYKREEVLGRNCRFLQGTETSPQKISEVKKAIASGEDVSVTIINYTADGTAFWNKLFIAALRDAQNNIVNFIGVIVKIASPDPDDPEANKLLPGEQHAEEEEDEDVKMEAQQPLAAAPAIAAATMTAP